MVSVESLVLLARHSFFQLALQRPRLFAQPHKANKPTGRLAPHDRAGERKRSQRCDKQVIVRLDGQEAKQKDKRGGADHSAEGGQRAEEEIGTERSML